MNLILSLAAYYSKIEKYRSVNNALIWYALTQFEGSLSYLDMTRVEYIIHIVIVKIIEAIQIKELHSGFLYMSEAGAVAVSF